MPKLFIIAGEVFHVSIGILSSYNRSVADIGKRTIHRDMIECVLNYMFPYARNWVKLDKELLLEHAPKSV
jgi:hypothetical protein